MALVYIIKERGLVDLNTEFYEESIEFVSKIYAKGKATFPFCRKISIVFLVIYTLLLLITFSVDGFNHHYLLKHVLTYVFCIIVLIETKPRNDYQNVLAKVTFGRNDFSVQYDNSNDCSIYIPKKSNTTILYKNIQDVKYDNLLQELFVQEGSDTSTIEAFFTMYVPEDESKILISKLTEKIKLDKNSENTEF